MDKTKQNKVARMIQKELGDIFQREGLATTGRSLLTITEVRITPDLSIALVFLSIFGSKEPKKIFDEVSKQNKEIRKKLGEKIRFKVRIIPELKFILDESLDYADKIDKLLKDAKNDLKIWEWDNLKMCCALSFMFEIASFLIFKFSNQLIFKLKYAVRSCKENSWIFF